MRVRFESKGDFGNTLAWLKRATANEPSKISNQIAKDGEQALAQATPKDTGETASMWESKVTTKGHISEIAWYNTAHPEAGVNIAKLIELGHGTGTGGYVPPNPYIKQAMEPVFKKGSNMLAKGLTK
jgi:hypothetical protein